MDLTAPVQRWWARAWFRRSVLTAAVLWLAWAVVAARLFVFPDADEPRRVDAIVMLGGYGQRMERAKELFAEGWAPVLAISEPVWANGTVDYLPECIDPAPGVLCFHPDPKTTRGEARAIRDLAAEYGWQSILVVTDTHQMTRAEIIIGRCFAGQVLMTDVAVDTRKQAVYRVVYETGALLRALFVRRGC